MQIYSRFHRRIRDKNLMNRQKGSEAGGQVCEEIDK